MRQPCSEVFIYCCNAGARRQTPPWRGSILFVTSPSAPPAFPHYRAVRRELQLLHHDCTNLHLHAVSEHCGQNRRLIKHTHTTQELREVCNGVKAIKYSFPSPSWQTGITERMRWLFSLLTSSEFPQTTSWAVFKTGAVKSELAVFFHSPNKTNIYPTNIEKCVCV